MDALNSKEQQEFQKVVEQKQMKDFMRLYSNLVERCFTDCVNDFTTSKLTNKEQTCIMKARRRKKANKDKTLPWDKRVTSIAKKYVTKPGVRYHVD
ncbi:CFC_HP_G0064930.mRNA.1.CDS.1 [Saccharomyces cerevisiae]|nr:CFC_HP_G0064930.mRNA.1.CDS.1 [Saccharomyces cerevisiae]CAI6614222.1 CFC_HP_G0064930.mRNA.1.CDS.1 [Saccharomyces cerevisiae]